MPIGHTTVQRPHMVQESKISSSQSSRSCRLSSGARPSVRRKPAKGAPWRR